jgi:hypothetical protein
MIRLQLFSSSAYVSAQHNHQHLFTFHKGKQLFELIVLSYLILILRLEATYHQVSCTFIESYIADEESSMSQDNAATVEPTSKEAMFFYHIITCVKGKLDVSLQSLWPTSRWLFNYSTNFNSG